MSEIAKQLKALGTAYRGSDLGIAPERLARMDAAMSSVIKEIKSEPVSRWAKIMKVVLATRRLPNLLPAPMQLALKPMVMLSSVIFFAFVGWITALSAFTSVLPGDPLYGLKLASERTHLSLTFNQDQRAELELELAGRRLEEVSKLAEGSLPDKQERLVSAVEDFKNKIASAQQNLQSSSDQKQAVVAMAKIVDRKATEYQKVLNQTAGLVSSNSQGKINEARDAAQAASFTAVTVMVEQQRTGKVSVEEVHKKVAEKLHELESQIQVMALDLTNLSTDTVPEVAAIGGPTVGSLMVDLSRARATLETGKNFLASGGFEAALRYYREGVGYLNQLQWGIGLYTQAKATRDSLKMESENTEARLDENSTDLTNEAAQPTVEQKP